MSAYVIINSRVTDPEGMAEYIPKAMASLAPYEHEFLVVEDNAQVLEGISEYPRMVAIRFNSRCDAESWYNSEGYQPALQLRLASSEGVGYLVDGFAPPAAP
jgi:uncharacterized protein (DUF1330 family)